MSEHGGHVSAKRETTLVNSLFGLILGTLEPGIFHYRWLGVRYLVEYRFVRLDQLFFYTVSCLPSGVAFLSRTVGYKALKTYDSGGREGEQQLIYTTNQVYRIFEGSRKGRVVPSGNVLPGERVVPAGARRMLQVTDDEDDFDRFCLRRKQDRYMLKILQSFAQQHRLNETQPTETIVVPEIYLTQPDNAILELRNSQSGEDIHWLHGYPGYDEALSPDINLRNMRLAVSLDAGQDPDGNPRRAYPFRHVCGQGVLTSGYEASDVWHAMDLDVYGTCVDIHPHIRFELDFHHGEFQEIADRR